MSDRQPAMNAEPDQTIFRLGAFLVDPTRCVLRSEAEEKHLQPKIMAVLTFLAYRFDQVVSRAELLDSIWAGVVVGDHVLTRCMSELRRLLGDNPAEPTYIQTLSKKGYRLMCAPDWSVSERDTNTNPVRLIHAGSTPTNTLAVFPFTMLGGDSAGQVLGVGMARDLTQLLSRVPGLKVIASSSVEHHAEQSPGPAGALRGLSARYVVSGTIEYRASVVRLRLELLDTVTSEQLWAGKYDADVGDLFDVQDELVQRIARSLSSALELGKVAQIQSRGSFDLSVYERIQLAEDARRNYSREAAEYIIENLNAALATQPDNGVAHALLAMQHAQNLVSRWCDNAAVTQGLATEHLREALRLAPNDARVLMAAGVAALMQGKHEDALSQLERSLAINPNEPHTLAEYGTARFYVTRELAPSITLIEQAEQAAPQHPRYSIWAYRRGICYYEAGRYDAAISAYNQSIARTPNYYHVYLTKALAHICMCSDEAAEASIRQGIDLAPGLTCDEYLSGVHTFKLTTTRAQLKTFAALWARVAT